MTEEPVSFLDVTVQGNPLTASPMKPTFTFNGFTTRVDYGESRFPAPPGPMHIEAHCRWLRRYGQASLDVIVPEQGAVHVYYASPMHQFTTGSMGLERQTRKGLRTYLAVVVVAVVVVVLLFG